MPSETVTERFRRLSGSIIQKGTADHVVYQGGTVRAIRVAIPRTPPNSSEPVIDRYVFHVVEAATVPEVALRDGDQVEFVAVSSAARPQYNGIITHLIAANCQKIFNDGSGTSRDRKYWKP